MFCSEHMRQVIPLRNLLFILRGPLIKTASPPLCIPHLHLLFSEKKMLVQKIHGLEIPPEINHLEDLNLWFLRTCVLARCTGAGYDVLRVSGCHWNYGF